MNIQFLHKAVFAVKNLNPTILTVVGVAGVVTSAVMASRATLKLQPVLEEMSINLETVELSKETVTPKGDRVYSDQELTIVKTKVLLHTGVDIVKLYGPSIIVGVISIAAISGGHVILLNRNTALAGALTATEKAFSSYRKEVVKEVGEDREREIRYGQTVEQIHDTKAGTVTDVYSLDLNKHSPYARMFDESNTNWERNAGYNKMFLMAQQEYANQRLRAHGYLLLNDVYSSLGFPKTSAGAVVGWAQGVGDDFVDFGMLDFVKDPRKEAFADGDERSILLDFNVAGVVYTLIGDNR